MLVLTRSIYPRQNALLIRAPDGTEIRVVLADLLPGGRASLGVEAPRDYLILREELLTRPGGSPCPAKCPPAPPSGDPPSAAPSPR